MWKFITLCVHLGKTKIKTVKWNGLSTFNTFKESHQVLDKEEPPQFFECVVHVELQAVCVLLNLCSWDRVIRAPSSPVNRASSQRTPSEGILKQLSFLPTLRTTFRSSWRIYASQKAAGHHTHSPQLVHWGTQESRHPVGQCGCFCSS